MTAPSHDLASFLIRSKLRPPQLAKSVLARTHLLDATLGQCPPKVTLIEAPAGYGKTTLLCQIAAALAEKAVAVSWLCLDEGDRDPSIFVHYLLNAVAQMGGPFGNVIGSNDLLSPRTDPDTLLATLLKQLQAFDGPVVLIFDDVHRAESSDVKRLMHRLIVETAGNCRLLIATRVRPDLALLDVGGPDDFCYLATHQLRFTTSEAANYLSDIEPTKVSSLSERLHGWPIALQLARLYYARDKATPAELIGGRSNELAAYFVEKVLASLDHGLQDTLVRISVVERFNGELIDVLCDRQDGMLVTDQIERANLFVSRNGEDRGWFSFHSCFRDFLGAELMRRRPLMAEELHRRAAQWFFAKGLFQEALRHATCLMDSEVARRLIEAAGGWRLLLSGGAPLLRMIASLPADVCANSQLQLAHILLLLKEGQIVASRALFEDLRKATANFSAWSNSETDYSVDAALLDLLIRIYEDREPDLENFFASTPGLAKRRRDDKVVDAIATVLLCQASFATNQYDAAKREGEISLARCSSLGTGYLEMFGSWNLGMSLLSQGERKAAESIFEIAFARAAKDFGPNSQIAWPLQAVLADVRYERDDLDSADTLIRPCLDALSQGDLWFDGFTSVVSTALSVDLALGRVSSALVLLDHAQRTARSRGQSRLLGFVESERVRILTLAGALDEAVDVATQPVFLGLIEEVNAANPFCLRIYSHAVCVAARLALALGRFREALQHVHTLMPIAEKHGCVRTLISLWVQGAVAQFSLGLRPEALETLRRALHWAVPQEFVRTVMTEVRWGRALFEAGATDARSSPAQRAFLRGILIRTTSGQALDGGEELEPARGTLSPREQEVLKLMAVGYTGKEIAHSLGVSESTVVTHRRRLYRKLEASSRSKALSAARARALLS